MLLKALMLAIVATLGFGPLLGHAGCASAMPEVTCPCCSHGDCPTDKSCARSDSTSVDQVELTQNLPFPARMPAVSADYRVLCPPKVVAIHSVCLRQSLSPPRLLSCPPQAVTCAWLI